MESDVCWILHITKFRLVGWLEFNGAFNCTLHLQSNNKVTVHLDNLCVKTTGRAKNCIISIHHIDATTLDKIKWLMPKCSEISWKYRPVSNFNTANKYSLHISSVLLGSHTYIMTDLVVTSVISLSCVKTSKARDKIGVKFFSFIRNLGQSARIWRPILNQGYLNTPKNSK